MGAAILNYSTKVPVSRTVGEVLGMLTEAGADKVMTRNVDRRPVGVSFTLTVPGAAGEQAFVLPVEVDAVAKVLRAQLADRTINAANGNHSRTVLESTEHAERVAWRIAKDWLEAQLALVQAHMVTFDQVMLPYLLVGRDETLYQRFATTGYRALEAGS